MIDEGKGAKFMRGLVKFVFVLCYAAFMWASIHHIAKFFDGFEQSDGNTLGSYMLAGAFDITALVTTIGVMFFRKSMPRSIQIIVWAFIIGIAGYSFFMNWEYTAHFQSAALILQPTGETTPIYDTQGVLHYVPVMRANTNLLFINPVLASGFTIFSLIYSVIAEFFGTKAPTVDELRARKQYLEETSGVLEEINKLEAKNKKPGFIQRGKQAALELKDAVKDVTKSEQNERITGPIVNPNAVDEVNSQQTPFDDENEQVSEQEQDTDKMQVVNISSVRKSRNNGTTKQAASRIRKALLANPDLTLSELVKKTKVSRSYASQIRSQVLSEQSEVRA